jgi:coatomer protein complex subunit alpha (xenin)
VDLTEYAFKIYLNNKKFNEVQELLQKGGLLGNNIINFLKEQGYSEIALIFEKNPKQRFQLALQCGNLKDALDCAKDLNTKDNFICLLNEAQKQGNTLIIEKGL